MFFLRFRYNGSIRMTIILIQILSVYLLHLFICLELFIWMSFFFSVLFKLVWRNSLYDWLITKKPLLTIFFSKFIILMNYYKIPQDDKLQTGYSCTCLFCLNMSCLFAICYLYFISYRQQKSTFYGLQK